MPTVPAPPQPLVSIITVVYNSVALLEGTIRSVAAQDYPHIEYLIVDGGSSDGTLGIIERHAAHISRWISEPDRGLYDAMNKGLALATGDFVWFLNSGDHIHAPDTLSRAMRHCGAATDVLYGEALIVDAARQALGLRSQISTRRLPQRLHWRSLRGGMVVCHQAFIARRQLAPPYLIGNLSADIDWVIGVLKKSRQNVHTGLVLCDFLAGGISKQRHRQSLLDRFAVMQRHYGLLPTLWYHVLILLRQLRFAWQRRGQVTY